MILGFLAIQDLKERMVYAVPIAVIHIMWSSYLLVMSEWNAYFLAAFWLVHFIIYLGMNHWNIWGSGDSDIFLLFGNVCLFSDSVGNGYSLIIGECIWLCVGLMLSIGINQVERKVSHSIGEKEGVAVIPGIAMVMVGLLIKGLCEGVM